MKKLLVVAALVLTIGVGSFVAYADTPIAPNIIPGHRNSNYTIEDRDAWNKERQEIRKEQIQNNVKEGIITEQEAKEWEEHFNYMEEFHNKNGYMEGGCGGHGRGHGRGHNQGHGMGRGMGMMRGSRL